LSVEKQHQFILTIWKKMSVKKAIFYNKVRIVAMLRHINNKVVSVFNSRTDKYIVSWRVYFVRRTWLCYTRCFIPVQQMSFFFLNSFSLYSSFHSSLSYFPPYSLHSFSLSPIHSPTRSIIEVSRATMSVSIYSLPFELHRPLSILTHRKIRTLFSLHTMVSCSIFLLHS